jgi:hypothetical protein
MIVDPSAFINDSIAKLPKLSSCDAQAVMKDLYDREYRIFDHFSAKSKPLSSIAAHYAESRDALITISDYIDNYIERDLHAYGITFEAYMSMPSYILKRVLDKVAAKEKLKAAAVNSVFDGENGKK